MIFRKKEEIVDPYTLERCNSCGSSKKRKFAQGDYVFKSTDKCSSCNNDQMMITKIFGEAVK